MKDLWNKLRGKKRYILLVVLGLVNYLGPEIGMTPEQIAAVNNVIAVLFGVNLVGDVVVGKK